MTGRILTTAAILLALVPAGQAPAADIRVPQDQPYLRTALDLAQPGDRVLVAPGTYQEWGLKLRDGVTLSGTGATADQVIVDGGGNGRILSCENLKLEGTVRNLTFVGGRAAGTTQFESSGGAIICNYSNLLLENCVFRDNSAVHNGGAVWVFESSPRILNCRFIDNTAGAGGGALDCTFKASPLIQDSWFEGNAADWGAAVSCRDYSSPTIIAAVFTGNATTGSHGYGGGLFSDLDSQPRLALCTFTGNTARYGGALANFVNSGATLSRCTVTGNTATKFGGGLYSYDAIPVVTASIVAFQDGAGLYSGGTFGPVVAQTNFYGNGGGEWIGAAAPSGLGDGNFSGDPLFCAPDEGDPLGFNLQDTSPCHPDSNGGVTLGAWPAGCGTPLPLLYSFNAEWQVGHPMLTWQIPTNLGVDPLFRLTGARQAAPETEWEIPYADTGGGRYVAEDLLASERGEGPFVYRLYVSYDNETWSLLNETELVPVPSITGLSELQSWPNPFNPATTISFRLGRQQTVRVAVYDLTGRRVRMLADRVFPSGLNEQTWDGRNEQGSVAASGTYMVLVEGQSQKLTRKVTLLK